MLVVESYRAGGRGLGAGGIRLGAWAGGWGREVQQCKACHPLFNVKISNYHSTSFKTEHSEGQC